MMSAAESSTMTELERWIICSCDSRSRTASSTTCLPLRSLYSPGKSDTEILAVETMIRAYH